MVSELRQRKLATWFRQIDVDGSGTLEEADLDRIARSMAGGSGYPPGSQEYEELCSIGTQSWELMQRLDADGDGKLTFDEAISWVEEDADAIHAFIFGWGRLLDADGDGQISADEYVQGNTGFVDPANARGAFARMDADGDGYLSQQEWSRLVDEWLRSDDPDAPGNMLFGPY